MAEPETSDFSIDEFATPMTTGMERVDRRPGFDRATQAELLVTLDGFERARRYNPNVAIVPGTRLTPTQHIEINGYLRDVLEALGQ